MSISAVIPVREGSTRVKDKNIRPFANKSLLQIKIEQLKRIEKIDRIIVSSDSKKMLDLARQLGVDAKERPKEYCDEKTKSFNDVVQYIANNEVESDVMMWMPCVCPLIYDKSIIEAIDLFEDNSFGYDSVVSAQIIKEYLFTEKGPLNFSVDKHVPSQKLPNWHIIKNGFFIARRKDMARWRFVYGPNPFLKTISKIEAIDIDDIDDFEIAELMYKKKLAGHVNF